MAGGRGARLGAVVLVGVVVLVGMTACDDDPSADRAPPPDAAQLQGFVDCLVAHGVSLPEPATGVPAGVPASGDRPAPRGVDPAAWASAQADCVGLLPTGDGSPPLG